MGAGRAGDLFARAFASLAATPRELDAAVGAMDDDEARWRPESGGWSIVEIVCHLADEDRTDFRARLEATLAEPQVEWTPIDPERTAREQAFAERSLAAALADFHRERAASIEWLLRHRDGMDLDRAYEAPTLGVMRAGDLLLSWAAHDLLHLRQITKRRYQRLLGSGPAYRAAYAGDWTA